MATVTSNQVTVTVVSSTTTGSYCTTGMYITIYGSSTTAGSGTSYPYEYSASIPSGYYEVSTPNFCVYYEGGDAPTGCYATFYQVRYVGVLRTSIQTEKVDGGLL